MEQYKEFIQIIIIIIKEKDFKKNGKSKRNKSKPQGGDGHKNFVRERDDFLVLFSLFILSQIYGNRTVDVRRSRRQNWYT